MTREEQRLQAAAEYRNYRERYGINDPNILVEIEDAYYEAIRWADENPEIVDILDEEEKAFADNVDAWREEMEASYKDGFNEAKKQFIDKACKFINQLCDGFSIKDNIMGLSYTKKELLKDFRKTMEE